jgi:hypothetical protein
MQTKAIKYKVRFVRALTTSYICRDQGNRMPRSISSFKKHPLLPVVALLASFFLLTGGVFHCCRINESLAEKLMEILTVSEAAATSPAAKLDEDMAGRHPACRGHGTQDKSTPSPSPLSAADGARTVLEPAGHCLSALSLAAKAMAIGEFPVLDLPVSSVLSGEKAATLINRVSRPRPHDKSSPPLYLITLHFLV